MTFLILRAWIKLMFFELYLARGNFNALYKKVRRHTCARKPAAPDALERVCTAVDMACIWYWKEVLCLQRSATTACLLRNFGVQAEIIIGVQQIPFKSHAWVEVDGQVVNDKPYLHEMYAVIDRF